MFNKRVFGFFATIAVLSAPQIASAQFAFKGLISDINSIINSLLPVISALALLAFFYGLALYVFKANDEEAQEQGKQVMVAGVVALFLMAAIGGIVSFLESQVFGSGGTTNIDIENPIQSGN